MTSGFDLNGISPALFIGDTVDSVRLDMHCQDILKRVHPYFVSRDYSQYNLRRLEACATVSVPLIIASDLPLHSLTALEIGCGRGMKSFPMAPLFKHYVGVDLEPDMIAEATRISKDLEIGNLDFFCANALDVEANPEAFGLNEKIDVLFLNAVMEHLTLDERVKIFCLMRRVKQAGGSIVFLESPNRLFSFDHHSTELHFIDSLPDDVALRYSRKKTQRPYALDFVRPYDPEAIYSADPLIQLQKTVLQNEVDPIVRLYRLGRGISYHDFELDYYCQQSSFMPTFDGYHPLLLNHQPLSRTELYLKDYFTNNSLGVHRLFSRSWIDFFDLHGKDSGRDQVRYLTPAGEGIFQAVPKKEFWSLDLFYCSSNGKLSFDMSDINAQSRFVLIVEQVSPDDFLIVECDGHRVMEMSLNALSIKRPPTWHKQYYLPISIPDTCSQLSVYSKTGSTVFIRGALVS